MMIFIIPYIDSIQAHFSHGSFEGLTEKKNMAYPKAVNLEIDWDNDLVSSVNPTPYEKKK